MSHLPHGHVVRDRYTVLSELGRGSFSWVYLASDAQWAGNLVALKEINTDLFTDEEYQQLNTHFLQEAAFLMTLAHPGLPRVIEFFAEGPRYYLAMEWVAGKTLEEHVLQGNRVEEDQVLDWATQIAAVLHYLHSREPYPVLLGDLKPSNVVLRYDGQIKVIDFGVARYVTPGQEREFSLVSPGFSPPEQYARFNVDQRSDIYAFGATLYWCLNPVPLEKLKFDIPPIRRKRPEISAVTENLLTTCLQVDARLRYPNTVALQAELGRAREALERHRSSLSASDILADLYRGKKKPGL